MDLRELVRVHLRDNDASDATELAAREEVLAAGMRLVRASRATDGEYELRDAVTDELIFRGELEDSNALFDDGKLADVDTVNAEAEQAFTVLPGVPEVLQEKVRQWVESNVAAAREWVAQPG